MAIRAEEITHVIEQELAGFDSSLDVEKVGTILRVGDNIATVYGLNEAMAGELLEFPGGMKGVVLNLEEASVGVALFGSDQQIKEGDTVRRTGRILSVPVGPELVGRVVNALGEPIDGKGPITSTQFRPVEINHEEELSQQSVDAVL